MTDLRPVRAEEFGDALVDFLPVWRWDCEWVQRFLWELSLQSQRNLLPWIYHPLKKAARNNSITWLDSPINYQIKWKSVY